MTTEAWAALVGAFLPAIVATVNRSDWKPWLKALTALGTSVVAGTVTALLAGDFTGASWATSIGVAFGASQVAYQTWWKASGITNSIEEKVDLFTLGAKKAQPELPPAPEPRHAAPESGDQERSFKKEE